MSEHNDTPAQPSKYTNRHGDRVSIACGEGRHQECTETLATCACTHRGLHITRHAYASTPAVPVSPAQCIHCGKPIYDNGTVYVHRRFETFNGLMVKVETQWCDEKSKQYIAESELTTDVIAVLSDADLAEQHRRADVARKRVAQSRANPPVSPAPAKPVEQLETLLTVADKLKSYADELGCSDRAGELTWCAEVCRAFHDRQPAAPSAAPDDVQTAEKGGSGICNTSGINQIGLTSVPEILDEFAEAYAAPFQARVRELEQKLADATKYLLRLLPPTLTHFADLLITCSQIDNYIVGLKERAETAEAERERLKAALRETGLRYHLAHANPGLTVSMVADCPFCELWVSALAEQRAGAEPTEPAKEKE